MSNRLYRISILLMITLAASGCVPTSRAQGLEPVPASVPARVAVSRSVDAGSPATAPGPIYLYQPLVARVAQAFTDTEEPDPTPGEPRVWFDVSLQPQLVELYNLRAHPNDIARVEHVSMLNLLNEVTVGRKLVIFKNAADAEIEVPRLADQFDIIGYNLEGGPSNLPEEQADPIGGARRVRNLADQYGLKVALGPSREFVLNYGAEMAPYVDIFVLQVQRVQTDHDTVREFVLPVVEMLLAANPDLEISVQIRTEGDAAALVELLESLGPDLAGVSILTSQDTLPAAMTLYGVLDDWRWAAGVQPTSAPAPITDATPPTAPTAPGEAGVTQTLTPTAEPRRTPTQTPDLGPGRNTPSEGPLRWLLFGSGLVFGVLVSMLAGTWIAFAHQRSRVR